MGWSNGTNIYVAVAENFTSVFKSMDGAGKSLTLGDRAFLVERAYENIINVLEECDWDTQDEALERIGKDTYAYNALLKSIGYNPECTGSCFQINCAHDSGECGCACHA